MCRLLALIEPDEGLRKQALEKFAVLAERGAVPPGAPPGHKDGWGIAAFANGMLREEKEPASAYGNGKFLEAGLHGAPPALLLSHLRKASVGGLTPANTHPFTGDGWVFVHNGSIGKKNDLAGLPLGAEYAVRRKGDTDSETFFLYVLELLHKAGKNDRAIAREKLLEAIDRVHATEDYTALDLMLSDGNVLFVVREVNEMNAKVKEGDLCDDYYTLFVGKNGGRMAIICSEQLDIGGVEWAAIPNHTLMEIDLRTHEERTETVPGR